MKIRSALIGATVLAAGVAVCSAQSLGEIAKKNAEAKAATEKDGKAKTPAKTFTDADLKADPHDLAIKPEPAPTASASKADATPSKDAKAEPAKEPAKDEAYWKDRMRTLQTKLSEDERELVNARIHVTDVEAFIRPDGTMSHTIADNLLQAQARRDTAVASIANDKREILELEEEARHAGVPPGWLRW